MKGDLTANKGGVLESGRGSQSFTDSAHTRL